MRTGYFCAALILLICVQAAAYERHPDGRITLSPDEANNVNVNFQNAMMLIQHQQAEIAKLRLAYETKACL